MNKDDFPQHRQLSESMVGGFSSNAVESFSPSFSFRKLGYSAKKSLGQNFIFDVNVTDKITNAGGFSLAGANVLEIGPGPCGLTKSILLAGANVFAIEKDEKFIPCLDELEKLAAGKLRYKIADALKVDLKDLAEFLQWDDFYIISNIPYNISGHLVAMIVHNYRLIKGILLTVQSEFAQRICAKSGEEYGRISVLAQAFFTVKREFNLPNSVFHPIPKISSSVVSLKPKTEVIAADTYALEGLCKEMFQARRKKSGRILKNIPEIPEDWFDLRPEELSVDKFSFIANMIVKNRGK